MDGGHDAEAVPRHPLQAMSPLDLAPFVSLGVGGLFADPAPPRGGSDILRAARSGLGEGEKQ